MIISLSKRNEDWVVLSYNWSESLKPARKMKCLINIHCCPTCANNLTRKTCARKKNPRNRRIWLMFAVMLQGITQTFDMGHHARLVQRVLSTRQQLYDHRIMTPDAPRIISTLCGRIFLGCWNQPDSIHLPQTGNKTWKTWSVAKRVDRHYILSIPRFSTCADLM